VGLVQFLTNGAVVNLLRIGQPTKTTSATPKPKLLPKQTDATQEKAKEIRKQRAKKQVRVAAERV
jgi:hypothetical protein